MTNEFKAGKREAYEEMRAYAVSMIGVNPTTVDQDPWLDMSFFAYTSMDELENGVDIPDLELTTI